LILLQGRAPSAQRLRIAIATSGRFHVLDLARELAALGHDVKLYSMLPDRRVEKFGLNRHFHRSLLVFVAPLVAWQRFAPRTLRNWQNWTLTRVLDRAVAAVLEPCDVLICMSGIFIRTIRAAKHRFGARVWLERASRHVLSQAEILAAIPGARGPTADTIARELEGYRLADRIIVPSRHVAESFERDPSAHAKLFVNPYGTKLAMFPYREKGSECGPLKLVFAGGWSLRKGCDVLEKAVCRCFNVRLRHVGSIVDLPFPAGDLRFCHTDAVAQPELSKFYCDSEAFVLASREEGLSVVLVQALASGLPIICTDRTGGEDLAHTSALLDRILVVPNGDVAALQGAIETLRVRLHDGPRFSPLSTSDLETLSWSAYGVRYARELMADVVSA
jgi:glycosyltransferase involved in cell wall biosynthesis